MHTEALDEVRDQNEVHGCGVSIAPVRCSGQHAPPMAEVVASPRQAKVAHPAYCEQLRDPECDVLRWQVVDVQAGIVVAKMVEQRVVARVDVAKPCSRRVRHVERLPAVAC